MGSIEEIYRISAKTQEVVDDYDNYVGGGLAPYPVTKYVALTHTKGAKAWDVDGKEYINFLSMYSVVNMDHGHPKILAAAVKAMTEGAVVNLPFHSPYYGKLARKLHDVRRCPILTAAAYYHGVMLSTVLLASKRSSAFGPFVRNVGSTSPSGKVFASGVVEDLREALEVDRHNIAAFMIESIQGSAAAALCKQHNVLFIVDEVQCGLGRAGANLSHLKENARPDVVVLGKALAGGTIGSTMAANSVGCAAAIAALDVHVAENLSQRPNELGTLIRSTLKAAELPHVADFDGAGLFMSLVLDEKPPKVTPRRIVSLLAHRGVLASVAGLRRIRICPPLTISKEELLKGAEVVIGVMRDIEGCGELPAEVLVDVRH
ncbi:PLP-dependent transferase [Hyaloscypha variabilis]